MDFSRIYIFWSANPEVRKDFVFEGISEQSVYSFENHRFDIDFQKKRGFVNELQLIIFQGLMFEDRGF